MTSPVTMPTERTTILANHEGGSWLLAQREVARLWLQGYDQREISERTGHGIRTIRSLISVIREQLRDFHKADLAAMSDQSVAAISLIQQVAWERVEASNMDVSKYLGIILHAEEVKAKIRGVITDQAKVTIEHRVKLYAIKDDYPELESRADIPSPMTIPDTADTIEGRFIPLEDSVVEASMEARTRKDMEIQRSYVGTEVAEPSSSIDMVDHDPDWDK